MNYKEFKDKIDQFICVPTPEQEYKLLMAHNSIHYTGTIGYIEKEPLHTDFEIFVSVLGVLQDRGAVAGKDFIVTCYQKGLFMEVALHSTSEYISDEDFVLYEQGNHDIQS